MHIHDELEERAREKGGGLYAIAFAILELADAHKAVARHLKNLGNGDASTPFGALEGLGMHIGEKLDNLTTAISELSKE
jgi:hypothetical protein